jgi:hypothetical protein
MLAIVRSASPKRQGRSAQSNGAQAVSEETYFARRKRPFGAHLGGPYPKNQQRQFAS